MVDLPRDLTVAEAVREYEASPDVAYAEPNFKLEPAAVPNDPGYKNLWGLNNTGQTGGAADADIDAPEAWNTTTGSAGTVVAVIDEGVDIDHPDLAGNIWTNPGEIAGSRKDDDKNGYVDDVNGYDFANDDPTVYDPDPITGSGDEHGTHVAGTIAATGNDGNGITGVSWDAQTAALKFIGAEFGYTSDAIEAINYAVLEGMPISNNSWGGGGKSQALQDAIAKADARDHIFVAAAGNGGTDGVGDNNNVTPDYPSSFDNPNIVAVAATDDTDRLASFSNFGSTTVDLAAPGVGILSTLPGNSYGRYSGTSMAAPHVAGVTALIKSENPSLDAAGIKDRIPQFAEKKAGLENKVATGGRANADASLNTQEARDAAGPSITAVRPVPGSKTRDRTPRIKATVSDEGPELRKSNIRLYLDGKKRTKFTYNKDTDRLGYTAPRLSYSKHTVKVVATDAAGNRSVKSWRFTVRR